MRDVHNRELMESEELSQSSTDSNESTVLTESIQSDETVAPTDSIASDETVASTDSTASDESAESVSSTNSDEEMKKYDQVFEDFLMDIYSNFQEATNAIEQDLIASGLDQSEAENQSVEKVMPLTKKSFRKEITRMLVISKGMELDSKYKRLFDKYDKYIKNGIEFPDAIKLAIRAVKPLLDTEIEDYIQDEMECDGSDEEDSTEQMS